MRQSVSSQGRTKTPQRTNNNFGNLRIDETNVDSAPRGIFEHVPCICKVNAIYPTFAKKLGLWIRPIALLDTF